MWPFFLVLSFICPFFLFTCGYFNSSLNNYQKWHITTLLMFSMFLYVFSLIFAITILIPFSWNFFYYDEVRYISIQPRISLFIYFSIKIILFSLLIFQVPIIYFYCLFYGIYSTSFISKNKSFILADVFFLVSLISPTDIISLIFIMVPLLGFYEVSTLIYLYDREYRKILNMEINRPWGIIFDN
jgi:Sec-independent protein secretion pathway component TatC